MGDFCVAGFHSRLPIYNGDRAIAIICRKNNEPVSNVPCYLSGPLVPFAMPITGEMNDYGYLNYTEDNETTAAIEKISGQTAYEVIEDICRVSQWDKEEDYPDFFKKFDKCIGNDNTYGRYHVIYEHYDIFESMTFDWQNVRNYCLKMDENLNKINFYETADEFRNPDEFCNPFRISYFNPFMWWFEHNKALPSAEINNSLTNIEDGNGYLSPTTAIYNVANQNMCFMALYNKAQLNFGISADDITKFCSFINTLEQTYGHFYYSVNAGQEWHHDTSFFKTLTQLQKSYSKTLKRLKSQHKR